MSKRFLPPASPAAAVPLAARRALAHKIRATFISPSSGAGQDPVLLDLAALLTRWESGAVDGCAAASLPLDPARPTDQFP